jgi:hypothetical protein
MMYNNDVPKWWNRQTRWTQNPVGLKPRAGSTPAFGTNFIYSVKTPAKSMFERWGVIKNNTTITQLGGDEVSNKYKWRYGRTTLIYVAGDKSIRSLKEALFLWNTFVSNIVY